MNISQGPHYIDDTLTFSVTTHDFATGALTDADGVPTYRVYEDETGTAIVTGSMAKLDDANTTGFYSEQLTLSAANGFEAGKSYNIYVSAAVDSVTGATSGGFKMSSVHPANVTQVSGDSGAADALELAFDGTPGAVPSFGIIDRGTAQAATGTTLQLRSAAAFADDELIGATILITGGSTGVGQRRLITDYVSATDTATVPTWTTTPTGTITYEIYATVAPDGVAQTGDAYARLGTPAGASASADIAAVKTVVDALEVGVNVAEIAGGVTAAENLRRSAESIYYGTVDSGTTTTIVDSGLTETDTDFWNGRVVLFLTGDLAKQATDITGFDPSSDELTVTALTNPPTAGDTFVIL